MQAKPFTVASWAILGIAAVFVYPATAAEKPESEPLALTRDTTPLDRAGDDRIVSYADVLEPVTPAVVSVYTSRVQKQNPREKAIEDYLRRYFGAPPREEDPQAPSDEPEISGLGSGFIVSADGYILTNNHVVKGLDNTDPDEITVQLRDGREYVAELVGADKETDVALLKIEAEDLPFLSLGDSAGLRIGDVVFAIGNPLGIGLTVTQGIVSAKDRTDLGILPGGYESFIQTDAAINRGNSGGPLIDGRGRVVGVNSAILSSGFGGGSIGLGFAIPIDLVARVAESLAGSGEVRRGFIGIEPGPLNGELARAFGLSSTKGAVINRVTPGLPADKAGLRHGDIILTVNGTQVDSVGDLIYLISRLEPETVAQLGILRGGDKETIDVTLGDRAALISGALESSTPVQKDVLKGVTLRPVSPALREDFNLPDDVDGLIVTEVDGGSPYARKLPPGTVLIEVNGKSMGSNETFEEALKAPGEVNTMYVYFNGRYTYTVLKIKE